MKKVLTILFLISSVSFYTQAQVNPHAIGLRFGGDGSSNGAEISYQHGLSNLNRLEFDLGFRGYKDYSNMFVSGTYQWDWNITEGLNWYVGPGAALGFYSWRGDDDDRKSSGASVGIGGQIGLEYDFNKHGAPILLSIDTRPMFDFVGYNNGFGWGASLGVRYTW
ncbi:MAG: hypothetical protein PHD06_10515 [Bacteroidales bacterium]|jgi:hypothetical protein|nr:hypothetical protein [Bacteroidales bacterium]MDD4385594.1 hypothetical protein [Bacteroidales bacterium]